MFDLTTPTPFFGFPRLLPIDGHESRADSLTISTLCIALASLVRDARRNRSPGAVVDQKCAGNHLVDNIHYEPSNIKEPAFIYSWTAAAVSLLGNATGIFAASVSSFAAELSLLLAD